LNVDEHIKNDKAVECISYNDIDMSTTSNHVIAWQRKKKLQTRESDLKYILTDILLLVSKSYIHRTCKGLEDAAWRLRPARSQPDIEVLRK
jgi:hypothetical protein